MGIYNISKIVCSYQKRLIENRGYVNQMVNTESSSISETWVTFLARNTTISKNTYWKLWKITSQGWTVTTFHILSPWKIFWKEHSKIFQKQLSCSGRNLPTLMTSGKKQCGQQDNKTAYKVTCLQGFFFFPFSPSTLIHLLFFNTFVLKWQSPTQPTSVLLSTV